LFHFSVFKTQKLVYFRLPHSSSNEKGGFVAILYVGAEKAKAEQPDWFNLEELFL
jgi:hypothetical protein